MQQWKSPSPHPGLRPIPPELHGFEAPVYVAVYEILEKMCLNTSLLTPIGPDFIDQFLIELSPQLQTMIFNIIPKIAAGQEVNMEDEIAFVIVNYQDSMPGDWFGQARQLHANFSSWPCFRSVQPTTAYPQLSKMPTQCVCERNLANPPYTRQIRQAVNRRGDLKKFRKKYQHETEREYLRTKEQSRQEQVRHAQESQTGKSDAKKGRPENEKCTKPI